MAEAHSYSAEVTNEAMNNTSTTEAPSISCSQPANYALPPSQSVSDLPKLDAQTNQSASPALNARSSSGKPESTSKVVPRRVGNANAAGIRPGRMDEILLFRICYNKRGLYGNVGIVAFWQEVAAAFQAHINRPYSHTSARRRVEKAMEQRKRELTGEERGRYSEDPEYRQALDAWVGVVEAEGAKKAAEALKRQYNRVHRLSQLDQDQGNKRCQAGAKRKSSNGARESTDADENPSSTSRPQKRGRFSPADELSLPNMLEDFAEVLSASLKHERHLEELWESRLRQVRQTIEQAIETKFQQILDRLDKKS
ncbi:hypothetical protein VTN31DRAFT_5333 [Thermomyces dupontii]|uniref:uncharacterized protein n=1 Tax=Talaromyces thermophilus TaxID=28565 RepID=UPI00374452B8